MIWLGILTFTFISIILIFFVLLLIINNSSKWFLWLKKILLKMKKKIKYSWSQFLKKNTEFTFFKDFDLCQAVDSSPQSSESYSEPSETFSLSESENYKPFLTVLTNRFWKTQVRFTYLTFQQRLDEQELKLRRFDQFDHLPKKR